MHYTFQLPHEFLIGQFFLIYFLSVLTCIALVPSSAINLGSPPCSRRVYYVDKEKDYTKCKVHTAIIRHKAKQKFVQESGTF